jgi:RNA polymerase sigma-70 factor (ECF subfamily)
MMMDADHESLGAEPTLHPLDGADPPAAAAADPPAAADPLGVAAAAAQRGDEAAFRVIYGALQPALLRYLRALVGADAEDVASESWLQIARDLGGFTGDGEKFRGWAFTIARHRAMDHLRHLRRRPAEPTPIEELVDLADPRDTAAGALDAVGTDAALALIGTLPRDQAEAILLRVLVGFDAETAGRILGKKAGAVRTAAYRGLLRLAALLEREPDTFGELSSPRPVRPVIPGPVPRSGRSGPASGPGPGDGVTSRMRSALREVR